MNAPFDGDNVCSVRTKFRIPEGNCHVQGLLILSSRKFVCVMFKNLVRA
jgi:hypothetical protein